MAAFTAVAAGIGLATTAATTGMSFVQAGKQRRMQRQAESEAEKAMAEARKKLEVNYYEALGIQKEPYELQREALLQQGAMGVEAGREGDVRGAAATVGRVQMAQQEAQAGIRSAMGQELTDLAKLTAAEESRLRDVGVGLDLEEVAGAQLAAANAQEMGAQAVQQGMQGVTSFGSQLAAAAPMFGKASGNQFGKLSEAASKAGLTTDQYQKQLSEFAKNSPKFSKLSGVGKMTPDQFGEFMVSQSPQFLKSLGKSFTPTSIQSAALSAPQQGLIGAPLETQMQYTGPSSRLNPLSPPSRANMVTNPFAINWANYLMPR